MAEQNIIERIKALLARAAKDRNPNAYEREVALRKAHELMEKHALSVLDLKDKDELGNLGMIELTIGALFWKRILVSAVAKLYGCYAMHFTQPGFNKIIRIYGREGQRVTSSGIATYLMTSIEREWKRYRKQDPGARKHDFCTGATHGVINTINRLAAERAAQGPASNSTEIVLVDHYKKLLDEAKKYAPAGRTHKHRAKVRDALSYDQGKRYGSSLSINPQMEQRKHKELA